MNEKIDMLPNIGFSDLNEKIDELVTEVKEHQMNENYLKGP